MKIKGTCQRDGRGFLAQQVIENGGHCPWDGLPFQPDYAGSLIDALRTAEQAGTILEAALERIAGMAPEFTLEEDSVLGRVRGYLEDLRGGAKPRVGLPRV